MNRSSNFEILLRRYLDGATTADEIARLEVFLRADPEARREFV